MGIKGRPNFEGTIGNMKVGEAGYTLPWALAFDREQTPYLMLDMPIKKAPLGTYALPIKRIGAGKSDYEINLNFSFFNKKHEWQISAKPFSGFVGLDESKIVRLNLYNPLINNKLENSVCDQESILELRKKLSKAISVEDYETAAVLRDKINITEKH